LAAGPGTIAAVTAEGWIFMVGLRVFDVGLLIVWLIWFFRLRDDDDSSEDGGGGGGGPTPEPRDSDGGGGLGLPLTGVDPSSRRLRDGHRPPRPARRRGGGPIRRPLPVRVRRRPSPLPAHRTR
jgi:hypothetical protein